MNFAPVTPVAYRARSIFAVSTIGTSVKIALKKKVRKFWAGLVLARFLPVVQYTLQTIILSTLFRTTSTMNTTLKSKHLSIF